MIPALMEFRIRWGLEIMNVVNEMIQIIMGYLGSYGSGWVVDWESFMGDLKEKRTSRRLEVKKQ